jgi:hypothetical protein
MTLLSDEAAVVVAAMPAEMPVLDQRRTGLSRVRRDDATSTVETERRFGVTSRTTTDTIAVMMIVPVLK